MKNSNRPPIVNPSTISALRSMDPIFDHIYREYGQPPSWSRPEGFETLSKIILEQQVSLQSAHATFCRLKGYVKDFTPSNILDTPTDVMRTLTVSRQKSRYLKCLAEELEEGRLDLISLSQYDPTEIFSRLISVTGIGQWTIEVYMMFALQQTDIFPSGDIALINTVKELKSVVSKEDVVEVASNWSPYRTAAAYFLWHYYLEKRGRKNEFV